LGILCVYTEKLKKNYQRPKRNDVRLAVLSIIIHLPATGRPEWNTRRPIVRGGGLAQLVTSLVASTKLINAWPGYYLDG